MFNRIEKELKKRGITQTEFCKSLGLSQGNFNKWKRGESKTWMKHLPKISEMLGLSIDQLTGNQEQSKQEEFYTKYSTAPENIRKAIAILLNVTE